MNKNPRSSSKKTRTELYYGDLQRKFKTFVILNEV